MYSLGNDQLSERGADVYVCVNQLRITPALTSSKRRDQGAIELELSDREAAEIGDRGKPCSEVVDGYDEPEIPQFGDDHLGTLKLADDACLSDLQDQRIPGKAVSLK